MYLDELEVGVTGSMIVMVCWIWDVNAIIGWYLSIDFVISDAKGTCSEGDYVGRHWEKLIEKRTRHVGLYPIVLTSFISSTLIMDDNNIPILKQIRTDESGVETSKVSLLVDFSKAKAGTLENLLMWGRNRKNDAATFNCEVRIDKVRTKKGWNYPAYGGDKCKKPAT
nr:hypothetical protein [Tanacetum cinerariifolium]